MDLVMVDMGMDMVDMVDMVDILDIVDTADGTKDGKLEKNHLKCFHNFIIHNSSYYLNFCTNQVYINLI